MRVRRTSFVLVALVGRIRLRSGVRPSASGSSSRRRSLDRVESAGSRTDRPGPRRRQGRHAVADRREVLRQSLSVAADLGKEPVHPGRPLDLPRRSAGAGAERGAGENLTQGGTDGGRQPDRSPRRRGGHPGAAGGRRRRRPGHRHAGAARRRDRHLLPGLRRRSRRAVPLCGRRLRVRRAVARPLRPRLHRLEGRQLPQQHQHRQGRPHDGRHRLPRRRPGARSPARQACSRR